MGAKCNTKLLYTLLYAVYFINISKNELNWNLITVDTVSPQKRRRIMGNVKSWGNKSTELKLIKLFKKHGLTGWKRNYPVKGKPDFVFLPQRVAIFVDGCFWHGCKDHCRIPSSNQDFWLSKINRNKERDIKTSAIFQERNWKVIRIWEHELKRDFFEKVISKIKEIV